MVGWMRPACQGLQGSCMVRPMDDPSHVAGVAQVIQAAVAPVFLLAGVAATLNVLASRIGRIIDRARIVEDRLDTRDSGNLA